MFERSEEIALRNIELMFAVTDKSWAVCLIMILHCGGVDCKNEDLLSVEEGFLWLYEIIKER